jgi:hypothetical protein
MTDLQAEKVLRELRAIKVAIWTGVLVAAFAWTTQKVIDAVFRPPPPPVTAQPPK